jgi:hypothetical protein
MILTDDRGPLDDELSIKKRTIIVLSGDEDTKSGEIHEFIEERDWDPWDRWFLVTDLSILTPEESYGWFIDKPNRHAVLGGTTPKVIAQKGSVNKLLRQNGKPSATKISKAFAKGDAA